MCARGEIIYNGAEACIYKATFYGKPAIIKDRKEKLFRHPVLDDKIRKKRVAQEVRSFVRCRKLGVRTPSVYYVDVDKSTIIMEYLEGDTLKKRIQVATDLEALYPLAQCVGVVIARLHDGGLIHGDLTTSNLIIHQNDEASLIDFGLSSNSALPEDKAVDLYVLERAFLSTHPNSEMLFEQILKSYVNASSKGSQTLSKLATVRMRGRKKLCIG
jgi:TP53 regulating kinase-like protein